MIYYVELPKNSNETAIGTFTIEGVGSEKVTAIYRQKQGCFAFIVKVAPKDYKKNVTLTVNEQIVYTTTVETYLDRYINGEDQIVKGLATALKTYCEAARTYFAGESVDSKVAFNENISAYAGNIAGNSVGVTNIQATLELEAKTHVNVYFTSTKTLAQLEVKGYGVEVSKVDGQENRYVATIKHIVAKDLDDMYTIQIDGYVVTYGALSYVYAIVNDDSKPAAWHNLAVALYNYNAAANAYFA